MTTCCPDLSQAVMKCVSASAAPTEIHYNAIKSIFHYLAATLTDGIHFYRTEPRMDLPEDPLPIIQNTPQDLLIEGRPKEDALNLCGYIDSSWADCPLTRRSTGRPNRLERSSMANCSTLINGGVLRNKQHRSTELILPKYYEGPWNPTGGCDNTL